MTFIDRFHTESSRSLVLPYFQVVSFLPSLCLKQHNLFSTTICTLSITSKSKRRKFLVKDFLNIILEQSSFYLYFVLFLFKACTGHRSIRKREDFQEASCEIDQIFHQFLG